MPWIECKGNEEYIHSYRLEPLTPLRFSLNRYPPASLRSVDLSPRSWPTSASSSGVMAAHLIGSGPNGPPSWGGRTIEGHALEWARLSLSFEIDVESCCAAFIRSLCSAHEPVNALDPANHALPSEVILNELPPPHRVRLPLRGMCKCIAYLLRQFLDATALDHVPYFCRSNHGRRPACVGHYD